MRLAKLDAAVHLGVSPSTVDRMIQRGDLQVYKEPHGTRYKVWVLFDDDSADSSLGESPNTASETREEPGDLPVQAPEEPGDSPPQAPEEPGDSPVQAPEEPGDSPVQAPEEPGDLPVQAPEEPGDSPVQAPEESVLAELTDLRERVKHAEERAKNLEGLADFRKKLLDDSEWRYQELLQQLKLSQETNVALAKAFPPALTEPTAGQSPHRRWWWPFGGS